MVMGGFNSDLWIAPVAFIDDRIRGPYYPDVMMQIYSRGFVAFLALLLLCGGVYLWRRNLSPALALLCSRTR